MAYDLTDKLVIGISSRALFDLAHENGIYQSEGVASYSAYQRQHEDERRVRGLWRCFMGISRVPGF